MSPTQTYSEFDPSILLILMPWMGFTLLLTMIGVLSQRRIAWALWPMLLLFWAFPSIMLEKTVLLPWCIALIASYAFGFPVLRLFAPRIAWLQRIRAFGLRINAWSARHSRRSGGSLSIHGITSFGGSGGSGSFSRHGNGSGYGGRGGSFGGGGASGSW